MLGPVPSHNHLLAHLEHDLPEHPEMLTIDEPHDESGQALQKSGRTPAGRQMERYIRAKMGLSGKSNEFSSQQAGVTNEKPRLDTLPPELLDIIFHEYLAGHSDTLESASTLVSVAATCSRLHSYIFDEPNLRDAIDRFANDADQKWHDFEQQVESNSFANAPDVVLKVSLLLPLAPFLNEDRRGRLLAFITDKGKLPSGMNPFQKNELQAKLLAATVPILKRLRTEELKSIRRALVKLPMPERAEPFSRLGPFMPDVLFNKMAGDLFKDPSYADQRAWPKQILAALGALEEHFHLLNGENQETYLRQVCVDFKERAHFLYRPWLQMSAHEKNELISRLDNILYPDIDYGGMNNEDVVRLGTVRKFDRLPDDADFKRWLGRILPNQPG